MKRYLSGEPVETCYIANDKQLLIDYKLNKIPLEEAEIIANQCDEETAQLMKANLYFEDKRDIIKEAGIELLERVKTSILEFNFKTELYPSQLEKKQKKYNNIFITSDLHFGHENAIKFENRPCKNLEEMDNLLIENWNSVVTDKDLVYILGDFSFYKGKKTSEILEQLKGDKILVEGNHDFDYLQDREFNSKLFVKVCKYEETRILCKLNTSEKALQIPHSTDKMMVLFHYPIECFNGQHKGWIHLYGHVHSNKGSFHPLDHDIPNAFNVSADVHNLTPVNILEFLKRGE